MSDMTEIKENLQEIEQRAYHDSLTGLPNRQLFMDRLDRTIGRSKRNEHIFAVLFIDLDNFKNINDSLGHAAGDRVLMEVADRLNSSTREVDTVSRLSGDEFAIIVENIELEQEAGIIALRYKESFAEPFLQNGDELFISGSIGIALYPANGNTAEEILKNADLAMSQVKEQGKDSLYYFTESLNEKVQKRMSLEKRLRRAVSNDEFDGANFALGKYNSRVWGAEALARYDYRPNVQWLGGFRYISLDEDIAFNYVDGVDGINFGQYRIESYNSLIGVQGGFDGRMPVGDGVDFTLTGLMGVFANRIEASQIVHDNIGDPGATNQLQRYQNDEGFATSFMGELRAGLEAALGSNIILGIGYQALFLTGIALAPDQAEVGHGDNAALGVDNRGAVLYHGGRAYAVWRFGGRD